MAMAAGSGGGSGGGDRTIRYPDVLETLGRDYQVSWGDQAHTEVKRVEGTIAQPRHFGEIPAARDFASVYRAAQVTYEATLRGIRQDLEDAAGALAEAGRRMRENDTVSADTFRGLEARWSTEDGFDSTRRHDEAAGHAAVRAGDDARERLGQGADRPATTGGEAGEPAGTDAGPAADTAPTMDTGGPDRDGDG